MTIDLQDAPGIHEGVKASGEKYGDPVVVACMSEATLAEVDRLFKMGAVPFQWVFDCHLRIDESVPFKKITFEPANGAIQRVTIKRFDS